MWGMTDTRTASQLITDEVTSWPGVEAGIGSRGEYGFTLGRRQLGHLHGDRVAHFGFPKPVWEELYAAGRITYHPVFPDKKGWASRRIESDEDVRDVIAMLRLNYDRAVERHGRPSPPSPRRRSRRTRRGPAARAPGGRRPASSRRRS